MISVLDMVESRWYLRFVVDGRVYFAIIVSKNLQKSSAIQNISITLFSVIIAIIVRIYLYFNMKTQPQIWNINLEKSVCIWLRKMRIDDRKYDF